MDRAGNSQNNVCFLHFNHSFSLNLWLKMESDQLHVSPPGAGRCSFSSSPTHFLCIKGRTIIILLSVDGHRDPLLIPVVFHLNWLNFIIILHCFAFHRRLYHRETKTERGDSGTQSWSRRLRPSLERDARVHFVFYSFPLLNVTIIQNSCNF